MLKHNLPYFIIKIAKQFERRFKFESQCHGIGSIWTDFKPQIEGLDRGKFTIVAWDPPGYGKSRPPDRTFPDDFFQRDANWAYNLMKALGYTKFSLVGWSDGGITSLMLASMFPNNIRKMVAVAANAYVTPEEVKIYKSTFFLFDYRIQIIEN